MAWNLNADRPIYAQLLEIIQIQIVSGKYKPGDRLPSVRELAAEAAVNPNTMQKAFAELERSGLILTQRTNGRTVTEDADLIRKVREELATADARIFLDGMSELGFDEKSTLKFLGEIIEKDKTEGENNE